MQRRPVSSQRGLVNAMDDVSDDDITLLHTSVLF
jgi:hypothetical protein